MENKVIVVFETLAKSHEVLKKIQPNFYPAGTFWLLGFFDGAPCLYLKEENKIEEIQESLFGKQDFIILKDDVLSSEEINILSKIIDGRDMYVIHHFNNDSPYIREKNDLAFIQNEHLAKNYKSSINQSHLDGYFYFDELVEILEGILSNDSDKVSKYNLLLQKVIEERFPDPILEAKLELLHLCLDFGDATTATLAEILKDKYSNDFEDFQKGLTEENHYRKLTILRDILLPS